MKPFTPVLATVILVSPILVSALQSPAPSQSATAKSAEKAQATPSSCSAKSKNDDKPVPTFLILGTVFNEKALSFPGVEVRIRRSDEKKVRWRTETNSRGEFAVRVPPGHEYEVAVHAKNYKDQIKAVDGKVDVQQRLSIELQPIKENHEKTGAKP